VKVLYLAVEAAPLAKVGGLGDVAGELPPALSGLGVELRRFLPRYPFLEGSAWQFERAASVRVLGRPAEIWSGEVGEVPTYLVDGEPIRESPVVYESPESDGDKFTFFCLAALEACQALDWAPDILHANDWHGAPAVLSLADRRKAGGFWGRTSSLLTVHNLPYMGAGGEGALQDYGVPIPDEPMLPSWARRLPLPAGLAAADWLSTVSPGYAEEIQTPEFGCGLELYLASVGDRLEGILNGIDMQVWDPATDSALATTYSDGRLEARAANKQRLQQDLGLPVDPQVPLLGMVTRLAHQKGVDLALEALQELAAEPWQFVILGTGETALEDAAVRFAAAHPDRAHAVRRFDGALARLIYAGSDMLLLPSRYEPCGLAQMIAMRYGSVPVVRSTGGLRDTVPDYQPGGKGLGFAFGPADPQAMAGALRRALETFADRRRWSGLQRRGMRQDFSWARSAESYHRLYRRALAGRGN
jgi:starch synthase